jgi:hypothetical protein
VDNSYFGLEEFIHRGKNDEGSTKYPSKEIGTTTGRSSEGNWGIGHCAR